MYNEIGYNVVVLYVMKDIEEHSEGELIYIGYACAILPENPLHNIKCFKNDSVRKIKVEDLEYHIAIQVWGQA